MSDQPDHGRQREQEEKREKPGRFRAEKMGISTSHETTKSSLTIASRLNA